MEVRGIRKQMLIVYSAVWLRLFRFSALPRHLLSPPPCLAPLSAPSAASE